MMTPEEFLKLNGETLINIASALRALVAAIPFNAGDKEVFADIIGGIAANGENMISASGLITPITEGE